MRGLKEFQREVKQQRREHPWASEKTLRRIASDHVRHGYEKR